MLPCSSTNDIVNIRFCNTKLNGNLRIAFSAILVNLSYLYNLFGCQRCFGMGLSFNSGSLKPTLSHRIVCVILSRTNKKVQNIATKGSVTMMADQHSFWNRSINKFPNESCCKHLLSPHSKSSIALYRSFSPKPAFGGASLLHIRPKTLFDYFRSIAFFVIRLAAFRCTSTAVLVSDTIVLHKSVVLICATLLGRQAAGASSFSLNAV